MPELYDFLQKMKDDLYKTNPAPSAYDMSCFIKGYADWAQENYSYPRPEMGDYYYGGYCSDRNVLKYSDDTIRKLGMMLSAIYQELTPQPCVNFKPMRGKCTVFSSKLGGVPYFPKDMEYPTVREGNFAGLPIRFLAQLNFAELPHIEGFPEKGILQFFTGCADDDCVGLDFKDAFDQNTYRIIYHSDIIEDESRLITADDLPEYDDEQFWSFPFSGEFKLCVESVGSCYAPPTSDEFDKLIIKHYNALFNGNIKDTFSNDEGLAGADPKLYSALYEASENGGGVKMGGFPFFCQDDPRLWDEEYAKCNLLLFQLDSCGDGDDEIMYGDCGVANFFISPEDLKNLDFSHVLYNWDCC